MTSIMLPQPWSKPWLPFSATRRPNSEIVTRVTRLRASPRSSRKAPRACPSPSTVLCMAPGAEVAVVRVEVPGSRVDGDHFGADVRLDQVGRVLERVDEGVALDDVG